MTPIRFFIGTRCLHVPKEQRRDFFSLAVRMALPMCATSADGAGGVYVTLTEDRYRALVTRCGTEGRQIPETVRRRGFPVLWERARTRPGLLAGGVLWALLLILSSLVVWRVDILCPDNNDAPHPSDIISTEDVRTRLAAIGIAPGMLWPGYDIRGAEQQFLVGQREVGWIAINRRGCVLSVEVRPSRAVEEDDTGALLLGDDGILYGANLVANADGRVLRWELRNGYAKVQKEQIVTKGELLATGILEATDGDVRYTRASGKVFASTVRRFSETVPLQDTRRTPTGRCETEKSLFFFGWEISLPQNVNFLEILKNFGKRGSIQASECDIIKRETEISLPDGTPLPIRITESTYLETEVLPVERGEAEAAAVARGRIRERLAAYPDLRVISCEETVSEAGGCVTVSWDVFCLDNIAEVVPFGVRPVP